MGWDGAHDRRKWLEAQKTKTWPYGENTCSYRKHHAHGQEDWFIVDVKAPDGSLVESFIAVTLWDGGYKKDMSESMGPYCYGCPIEWLDEVPEPPHHPDYNWRDRRRKIEADRLEAGALLSMGK
jgi:hypothetical protein